MYTLSLVLARSLSYLTLNKSLGTPKMQRSQGRNGEHSRNTSSMSMASSTGSLPTLDQQQHRHPVERMSFETRASSPAPAGMSTSSGGGGGGSGSEFGFRDREMRASLGGWGNGGGGVPVTNVSVARNGLTAYGGALGFGGVGALVRPRSQQAVLRKNMFVQYSSADAGAEAHRERAGAGSKSETRHVGKESLRPLRGSPNLELSLKPVSRLHARESGDHSGGSGDHSEDRGGDRSPHDRFRSMSAEPSIVTAGSGWGKSVWGGGRGSWGSLGGGASDWGVIEAEIDQVVRHSPFCYMYASSERRNSKHLDGGGLDKVCRRVCVCGEWVQTWV